VDAPEAEFLERSELDPQPIAAFVCLIEYGGEPRLITCRRYELRGEVGYIGAICHSARGYRTFRCDRIEIVSDARTGEVLGDGSFFARFSVDAQREAAPTWGLTPSRRATLVAGLNVLAFMARCDGAWHELESEVVERFICSMWLRNEWPGDPAVSEILAHAQRLSPDAETFMDSLRCYADCATSTMILKRAVGDLIAADGILHAEEMNWGAEVDAFFRRYKEEQSARLMAVSAEMASVAEIVINIQA
jgi:hypothetical protein